VYILAVSAVVSGHFSPGAGVLRFFAISAGGVAIGVAAGWLSGQVRRRIDDASIETAISLLTAYLAYVPAQRLGASGVLAAVAAGLYASHHAGSLLSPASRLRVLGFWEVLTFLLESVLFLLIGLQLEGIVSDLRTGAGTPLLYAAAVLGALVLIRMAWMFIVPAVVRMANLRSRGEPRQTAGELVVLGWSGMRGGVSLAAALAIPLTAQGRPFADRGTLIFIAYVAIATTLVVPGLTVGPLVRRLGLGEADEVARAERDARIQMARAALKRLDELGDESGLDDRVIEQLRTTYELRLHRLVPHGDGAGDQPAVARAARGVRRELIEAERRRLGELRHRGEVTLGSQRRLEHDLDLEASRLGRASSTGP
jgi:CPA1 family monovalent cation:H+ antiporter